ncbi:MAG: hypothetical protein AcusKO_47530 [Acuticoccus sp.]
MSAGTPITGSSGRTPARPGHPDAGELAEPVETLATSVERHRPLLGVGLNENARSLEERIDVFQTIWGQFYEIDVAVPQRFVGRGRAYVVADMLAGRAALGDVRLAFRAARSHSDSETALLSLVFAGERTGASDGQRMSGGWITLHGFTRSWSSRFDGYDYFGVLMPRHKVGYDPDGHGELRIHRGSPNGRLLATAILSFKARLPFCSAQDAPRLADELCEIVRCTLVEPRARASGALMRKVRKLALRQYIDEHLTDLSLSADTLCAVFGMSRASLYRLFAEEGGIASHIRSERMRRCLLALAEAQGVRGEVARVAAGWGFTDGGNFNREFRARFGVRPSDMSGADPAILQPLQPSSAVPDGPASIGRIDDWIRAGPGHNRR